MPDKSSRCRGSKTNKSVNISQDGKDDSGDEQINDASSCQPDTKEYDSKDIGGEQPHASGERRVVDSEEILAGRRDVWIRHGDDIYRLRLTSSGRLYLSK